METGGVILFLPKCAKSPHLRYRAEVGGSSHSDKTEIV